jgi:membrane protein DedA with SNARE-associated domain
MARFAAFTRNGVVVLFGGLGPYLALLGAIWIASVGVPIPEDIALLGGGFACYQGYARVLPMILVAMFAVLSGDLFIFYLGHRWASNLLEHRMTRKLATPDRVAKLKVKFHEHQLKTIFIGRFLPGVRALVFLTAGAMKISVWKFLLMNGLAAAISIPVFVILGYVFGKSYDKLTSHVADIKHIAIFVLIGIAIMWVLWLAYSRSARVRETEQLLKE